MIKLCFNDLVSKIEVQKLTPSKELLENIKMSHKYSQIKKSIMEVGLVEPIVIYFDSTEKKTKILDGHLRVEALKELGASHAPCLVSTIDDAYTPNKHVNHINIIQEHRMYKLAAATVPVERLSAALGVSVDILKSTAKLLDGIDPSVINKLADKHVPKATFAVIKKMKPIRQIEAVETMINFDNYTKSFAASILSSTPDSLLVDKNKPKNDKKNISKTILRLEKEMSITREKTSNLEHEYGANTLKLVIIKSYVKQLLTNQAVLNWLIDFKPDYLRELKRIDKIDKLDEVIKSKEE